MKSNDNAPNIPHNLVTPELLQDLESWHEGDEYQKIIDTIQALPPAEQTPDLISQLARAYVNLAGQKDDRELFARAVELLESVEEELSGDHNWNFRMGYALYYLDQEWKARSYFENALKYRPGDEDTLMFIDDCNKALTLPNSMKPFSRRTADGWQAFLEGEKELRDLIDAGDYQAVVDCCHRLLRPAMQEAYFEIGKHDGRYQLILSADGDRARVFKLVYFKNHAPEAVAKNWDILVGRQPAPGFELRMLDQCISTKDVFVWAEDLGERRIGLNVYCEKLADLLKEGGDGAKDGGSGFGEDQAYSILAILLDQAIGEISAIGYVEYLELLDVPRDGEYIRLSELAEYIRTQIDPQRKGVPLTADELCQWYTAYSQKPTEEEDYIPREDIFAGATCCLPLVSSYYRGDDAAMEDFHMDGAVPGFFFYPLDGIPKEQVLNLRDRMEQELIREAEDAVTFIGGATGVGYGYLDFIAWDLSELLDTAVKVFAGMPVEEAFFHTFRVNVGSVCLKRGEGV